jgi:hypothetical protein
LATDLFSPTTQSEARSRSFGGQFAHDADLEIRIAASKALKTLKGVEEP